MCAAIIYNTQPDRKKGGDGSLNTSHSSFSQNIIFPNLLSTHYYYYLHLGGEISNGIYMALMIS